VNLALIRSNVLTAKVIIKLTPPTAHSGSIDLTRNGIPKNTPSFGKLGRIQFVQP